MNRVGNYTPGNAPAKGKEAHAKSEVLRIRCLTLLLHAAQQKTRVLA